MTCAVTIVGLGDDGCVSLSSRAFNAVAGAQVLIGGTRHLAFFPEFTGQKIPLKNGLAKVLDQLPELCAEQNVCILASGDPMFFGIGSMVIGKVGAAQVEVLPQPSAMQWAFAKTGLKWDDAAILSLHARRREGFLTRLRRYAKIACFTDAENSPSSLAAYMLEHGQTGWRAWVCENLGGIDERVRHFATLAELAACGDIGALNVLILQRTDEHWRSPPAISYWHEDAFAKRMPKKGLITKREARMLSLAALNLGPGSVMWDIGAGSGSVAIEAAMIAYEGRAYAVEIDPEGVAICRENIKTHAIDNVRVIHGAAPEALADLETPDAVFVGGSKGSMRQIVEIAWDRLRPGGRLVINAITLENINEAYSALRAHGLTPEVTLLNVSRGEPLGRYLRYEALNPINIFAVTKPLSNETAGPVAGKETA